jgi:hypothetical protein
MLRIPGNKIKIIQSQSLVIKSIHRDILDDSNDYILNVNKPIYDGLYRVI